MGEKRGRFQFVVCRNCSQGIFFVLISLYQGTHYETDYNRGRIILVESGRIIQGDILIKESALNEVVPSTAYILQVCNPRGKEK